MNVARNYSINSGTPQGFTKNENAKLKPNYEIYKGRMNGEDVAVKLVPLVIEQAATKLASDHKQALDDSIKEAKLLSEQNHPNIINLNEYWFQQVKNNSLL